MIFVNAVAAQQPIRYEVSFPNYVHHEAQIRLFIPQVNGTADIRMSRSSPGRYATHEFGKNVYDVKAYDSASKKEIKVIQRDGDIYSLSSTGSTVVVEYTLFADYVDGTYAGIDRTHAHLNMPASFMWVVGQDKRPIEISFTVPEASKWKIATQLKPGKIDGHFFAPDLQYFMDSPTELSDYKERNWTVKDTDGKSKLISVVIHGDVADDAADAFAEQVRKVVNEAGKVFGELPDFEYGKYTFLIDLMPANGGDGMEHRNSTVITGRAGKLTIDVLKNRLGTVSHEFFHAWNVERIRPKTLEPFNFTKANMSDELWVAEGFTQYYGGLLLTRAGLQTDTVFLRTLGFYLNGITNLTAGKTRTPIQASRLAIYTDAATAIDKTNFGNLFYSYYSYGAAIAGVLDLTLRKDHGKSLDAYMQLLWQKFGRTGRPYTVADLEATMAELTNPTAAKQFFTAYVYGIDRPSLQPLLSAMGVVVENASAGKASIGAIGLKVENGRAEVTNSIQKGSPVYEAGLEMGDVITSFDGKQLTSMDQLKEILDAKKPGDIIPITFNSRGIETSTSLRAVESNSLTLRMDSAASAEQAAKRAAWLGGK
jgi:predicted metalloprotease with PDZ domain